MALRVDVGYCSSRGLDVCAFDQLKGNGRCNVGGARFGRRLALSSLAGKSAGERNGVAVERSGGRGAVVPVRGSSSVVKTEEVTRLERAVAERGFEVDTRVEGELKEGGFRSVRRTKLVATIGPSCCTYEQLEALASSGVNVARLNMCHGTHEWHRQVIRNCRRLSREKGYGIVVMIDTEGSEIHMGDLGGASSAKAEVG
jgi:hypothetical protein